MKQSAAAARRARTRYRYARGPRPKTRTHATDPAGSSVVSPTAAAAACYATADGADRKARAAIPKRTEPRGVGGGFASPKRGHPNDRSWRSRDRKCTGGSGATADVDVPASGSFDAEATQTPRRLNSAARLCGPIRLPLDGFTYC